MLALDEQKELEQIQRLFRTDDGKVLINKIQGLCHRALNQLKTVREPIDLGRQQGRVEAFEQILKLKEE